MKVLQREWIVFRACNQVWDKTERLWGESSMFENIHAIWRSSVQFGSGWKDLESQWRSTDNWGATPEIFVYEGPKIQGVWVAARPSPRPPWPPSQSRWIFSITTGVTGWRWEVRTQDPRGLPGSGSMSRSPLPAHAAASARNGAVRWLVCSNYVSVLLLFLPARR